MDYWYCMKIELDIEDSAPLFAQLIEQVKTAVLNNELRPGDAVPSIRQLAGDLDINHKTVAKAYRLLERDSVIQAKRYRGTYVHPDAKANCDSDLSTWAKAEIGKKIDELRNAGVTDSEIRIVFGELMNNRKK